MRTNYPIKRRDPWSRGDKIGAATLAVAVVIGIATIVVTHLDAAPGGPSIDLKDIDFREPIVAGTPTPLRADFVNGGASPAFGVRPKIKISRLPKGADPDYDVPDISGSTGTVGAKLPFDVPGSMRAIPQEQIDAINSGELVVYVTADIAYSDSANSEKRHHKYFCVQYQPSSGKMVGCKIQREST